METNRQFEQNIVMVGEKSIWLSPTHDDETGFQKREET